MKRRIITVMLALVLSLLPVAAFAQTTVNNSGFSVQNLGTAPANVTVTYYKEDGTTDSTQVEVIPVGSSFVFFGATMKVTAGFKGSVSISSDQPIVAITNLLGPTLADAYNGFSGGATTVNLPLILRGNFGLDTWMSVQNTGSVPATVTVTYTPGEAGTAGVTESLSIAPGAAKALYQKNNTGLGTRFVGSGKITSDQPVVAVVNEETQDGRSLFSYGGFTSAGSNTVVVPLIISNNFGQFTGIQIQNTGTATSDVTVTYSANTVTTAGTASSVCGTPPATAVPALAAGAAKTLIQGSGPESFGFIPFFASCRYVGAATITSTASPLAVTVNQVFTNATLGSTYVGVDPAATGESVNAPVLQANNFSTFSGIQIANTGAAATTVTVTFGPNTAATDATPTPAGQTNCAAPAPKVVQLAPQTQSFVFEWMAQGIVSPIPEGYKLSANASAVLVSIQGLEPGQQITVLRNSVLDMGFDTSKMGEFNRVSEPMELPKAERTNVAIEGVTNPTILAYMNNMNANDFETLITLFEPDGALQPPFQRPIVGQDAVLKFFREECQNLKLIPERGMSEEADGGYTQIKVTGKCQTPWFGGNVGMNIAWRFLLNPEGKVFFVAIDLLASPKELLNFAR